MGRGITCTAMLLIRLFGVVCCSGIGWGGIASVDESNKHTPDISGSPSDTVTSSNEAVQEDDTYSMYKKLMDMREDMVERQERQESEALKCQNCSSGCSGDCVAQFHQRFFAERGASASRGPHGEAQLSGRRGVRGGGAPRQDRVLQHDCLRHRQIRPGAYAGRAVGS